MDRRPLDASRPDAVGAAAAGHSPSDEDLLTRTGTGDRPAFEMLYERFGGRVHGLALKVLRDRTLAEDTTQEVMVELWRTAPRFDASLGTAASWIMTLTHRRAVDAVRREQALRDRQQRSAERDAPRIEHPVGEQVDRRDTQAEVRQALTSLTSLQRESIELAFFGGHTHREVADILDAPLGTIKTRIRDGMQRLRLTMEVTS